MSVSLNQLNKRLSVLEKQTYDNTQVNTSEENSPSKTFLSVINEKEKKKKEEIINKVHQEAQNKIQLFGVDANNIISVISFVVDFVEHVVEYVPDIVKIVNGALKGDLKLQLAIDLIFNILGDISSIFDTDLLTHMINHDVSIKFNQNKQIIDGQQITTTDISKKEVSNKEISKNKKKSFFRLGSNTKKKD